MGTFFKKPLDRFSNFGGLVYRHKVACAVDQRDFGARRILLPESSSTGLSVFRKGLWARAMVFLHKQPAG